MIRLVALTALMLGAATAGADTFRSRMAQSQLTPLVVSMVAAPIYVANQVAGNERPPQMCWRRRSTWNYQNNFAMSFANMVRR